MRANDERYGVILSDLTEPLEDSPSNPLFNDDVFALIKSRLADGGVYVLQASTAARATTPRCTARWRARCAATTRTSPRSSRTCRRSIREWAFLACSDRVDLAALDARADRCLLRAPARRELLLRLASRTGGSSRCRSTCAGCWPPAGIRFKRTERPAIYGHRLFARAARLGEGEEQLRRAARPEARRGRARPGGDAHAVSLRNHQRHRRRPRRRDRQPLRHGVLRRARLDLRPRSRYDDRRAAVQLPRAGRSAARSRRRGARAARPAGASSTAKSTCAAARRSSRTPRSTSSTPIPKRNPEPIAERER